MNLQKIMTGDGTFTLFNKEYGETYHSTSGALEERQKKFVQPLNLARYNPAKVLDICFGLGYNAAVCMDAYLRERPNGFLHIVALEKDETVCHLMKQMELPLPSYQLLQKLSLADRELRTPHLYLTLTFGDATETLAELHELFHAVLLDPFSPKKNPAMWSLPFFEEIFAHMEPGGMLTTYSCAGIVRRNMKEAGFKVMDGPSVGRRSPSTIAAKPYIYKEKQKWQEHAADIY
ncbi:hypothetical protein HZB01_02665 [Candidatus Woesearchaeota archaeon]|nr:hypothetical protein [Candidatus Woesearchaeota archaeon]